jgi:hypothetical protein
MLGAGRVSRQIRKVDIGLVGRRKLLLGLLSGLSHSLESKLVTLDVHTLLLLELSDEILLEAEIEVLTTEGGVTVGGLDLKDTSGDFEDGDIESTTTEIVNSDDLTVGLVKTESKSGSGGLVDNSLDLKVGNLASVLGCLSLGIVEISRNGDDGLLALGAEISLSGFLHLHEHKGTNLLRGVLVALGLNPGIAVAGASDLVREMLQILLSGFIIESSTNESLGCENGVFRVGNSLKL